MDQQILFPDPTPKQKKKRRPRKHKNAPKIPDLPSLPISASHMYYYGYKPLHQNTTFLDRVSEEIRTLIIDLNICTNDELLYHVRKNATKKGSG